MSNAERPSKNARREHAREVARKRQEEERKRRLRNRILLQGGIGLAIAAIVVVIILVITSMNSGSTTRVSSDAGPKNMITDGIQFQGVDGKVEPVATAGVGASATPSPVATTNSDGAAKVVTYIDWACPVCKQFEASYSKDILSRVASGKATLEIHPVSILDRNYQNSRYASRAANAAACVANYDPDNFLSVQTEFYDNQPAEGSSGLSDTQIKKLVRDGGVSDASVASCIDDEQFGGWVTAETNRVLADKSLVNPAQGGFGTPTVFVNGTLWSGSTDLIAEIDK